MKKLIALLACLCLLLPMTVYLAAGIACLDHPGLGSHNDIIAIDLKCDHIHIMQTV